MAGKQVYMVTDKVTKEVKDMVGEYNEWLRDKVVQSKFFFNQDYSAHASF